MATMHRSPAAQLLRSSRLFSLPPPLPAASVEVTRRQGLVYSETATLPYPTHQAISTPASSLARGDWGLKRPLPTKYTKKQSNPVIRLKELDTIEHFTDFESAGDHAKTLEKWQEMDVPIAQFGDRDNKTRKLTKGAYEDDNTASMEDLVSAGLDSTPERETAIGTRQNDRTSIDQHDPRWKFKGPAIITMSEAEFMRFVEGQVHNNRSAFTAFLRQRIEAQYVPEQRKIAKDEGRDFVEADMDPAAKETWVNERMRQLRLETTYTSELARAIRAFFDLPPFHVGFSSISMSDEADRAFDYEPPTTHHAAGLGYLRTGNFLRNHAVLGPQARKAPVTARVVQPTKLNGVTLHAKALLGVGGFVAKATDSSSLGEGLAELNIDTPGGSKTWVVPTQAWVDSRARVRLSVEAPQLNDKQIAEGQIPTGGQGSVRLPSRFSRPSIKGYNRGDFLDDGIGGISGAEGLGAGSSRYVGQQGGAWDRGRSAEAIERIRRNSFGAERSMQR